MDAKRKRLREIMCQLQQGAKEGGKQKRHTRKDVINYHGPYVDSSGEKFYLPRKWTLCPTTSDNGKTTQRRYKECGINYSFNEMKGSDLMKNLQWLGQFGRLRTLLDDEVNDDNDDDNNEDAEEQSDLIGGGGPSRKRQHHNNASYKFEEERNIQRAMPEMEGTLRNWTLHGQNLGTMLKNYKRQYRHLPQTIEENSVNSSIPPQQCWTP